MKHKTSELTGPLLDAAVALALGWAPVAGRLYWFRAADNVTSDPCGLFPPPYSSSWFDGGPIKARERISTHYRNDGTVDAVLPGDNQWPWTGQTELEAAMRAFVSAKLGDEVELP